ncbi:MAG: hypothetical protein A4E42_00431 [Methanoregulaceae archaeon PtaU1.Bin222]|nr:MAG: hypothetical protein A4E42_00431 [Methanoregulaceae archaeon PtaU1.Bin222]
MLKHACIPGNLFLQHIHAGPKMESILGPEVKPYSSGNHVGAGNPGSGDPFQLVQDLFPAVEEIHSKGFMLDSIAV